jgi:prepilin-type processing-associated H-X9-DG protein
MIMTEAPLVLFGASSSAPYGQAHQMGHVYFTNNYLTGITDAQKLLTPSYGNHDGYANFLFKDGHVSTYRVGTRFGDKDNLKNYWTVLSE